MVFGLGEVRPFEASGFVLSRKLLLERWADDSVRSQSWVAIRRTEPEQRPGGVLR